MQQVEIVTTSGSQHFQPQNPQESYHAVVAADGSVDVVLTVAPGDGSAGDESVVASFDADEVEQVTESSAR